MHKEAASVRQKTGQEWQTIAGDKEAEVVRLRAEIGRLRQALSSTTQAHSTQADDVASLQAQLQEALALNKAQQRQAVVTTSAADGPSAELHRLRSELDARTAALERAEADLSAQAASASARMAELQDSFHAKIAEMRRTQQQQLEQAVAAARAAAASDAAAAAAARTGPRAGAAALEQQNAQRLQRAESDAIALRKQLDAAQATVIELQGKLDQVRSEADSSRSQLTSTQFSEKALKARVKELEGQVAKLQQQRQREPMPPASAPAPLPAPPAPAAPAVDMSMLAMMEGQLGRLSEIIRARESEVTQMRAALQVRL
ncbi:hypothetical protein GPECTOR_1g260 [Gonium pectorale]|uniref:Uncharacterized protein n=1 Tax=Gonium pectorale TaxID=33097 RepID=A0A150H2B8_GONPE|nr:hypothetical protein GPECTOR_1g260 [Gonium pectorale]|eukprot:KXZ56296.1 hypothetical protein GPECTOR_1g260 [Gonium pectorale]